MIYKISPLLQNKSIITTEKKDLSTSTMIIDNSPEKDIFIKSSLNTKMNFGSKFDFVDNNKIYINAGVDTYNKIDMFYEDIMGNYNHIGGDKKAIDDLNNAIRKDPANSDMYCICKGLVKHIVGDKDGAKSEYSRAKKLNPELFKELSEKIIGMKKDGLRIQTFIEHIAKI